MRTNVVKEAEKKLYYRIFLMKNGEKTVFLMKKSYICMRIKSRRMKDSTSKGFISHKYLNIKKRDGFAL